MVEEMIDGATIVDARSRVVWFSEGQLSLLGGVRLSDVVGQEIERVIPHSRLREVVETGRPQPLDIIQYGEKSLLVTRLPLKDESGTIIGAFAYALKNSIPHLRPIAERVQQLQSRLARMEQALSTTRTHRYTIEQILGASTAMREVGRLLRRAAEVPSPVLLLGETGTGKEMVAHAIHAASARVNRPFVAINVAAVPENLLEAEFFGVAPGAFTGAGRQPRPVSSSWRMKARSFWTRSATCNSACRPSSFVPCRMERSNPSDQTSLRGSTSASLRRPAGH